MKHGALMMEMMTHCIHIVVLMRALQLQMRVFVMGLELALRRVGAKEQLDLKE